MKVIRDNEFNNHLSASLNGVNNDKDILIVSRGKGKTAVIMDLDEYNAKISSITSIPKLLNPRIKQ